jgi:hypothetical protein
LLLPVILTGGGAAAADWVKPPPDPPGSGQLILSEGSLWRAFHTWRTPQVRKDGKLVDGPNDAYGPSYLTRTPEPPADWTKPEFADGSWSRLSISRHPRNDYCGVNDGPTLSLLCLRGRFSVDDPEKVRGMTLSLAYRGGAVVYLNGKELARANLPKDGPLTAETLADDYPPEVFVDDKGQCVRNVVHDDGFIWASAADTLAKRIRGINGLEIKPADLRKGANVLAVEIHRAPYFGPGLAKEDINHVSVWSTCGLVRLALRAEVGVAPGGARPAGLQVWGTNPLHRSIPGEFHDPLEKPAPVAIVGCRNGSFVGKVTVSSTAALSGVGAQMSDLRHSDGKAVIPAAKIEVLYSVRDDAQHMSRYRGPGFWETLLEAPPSAVPEGLQPVIVKVRVPGDAAAGDYRGKLTVNVAGARPVEVPVELRVFGWKLPDSKDYVTHMGLVESPESVALKYKVPFWSEEHWKLIEKSFRLMGEVGNRYVAVPLICRTNFGNEQSMVRWVKDGGNWKFDFAVFDRYLDIAQKYQKMDVVCLYIWDYYTGHAGWTKKAGTPPLVTCRDPAAGKSEEIAAPTFESPEGKKVWGQLAKEVMARLEQRGLAGATMLGISSEWQAPTKEVAEAFREFFPNVKWVYNGHPDTRGRDVSGIPIGYNTAVYINLLPPPGGAGTKDGQYHGWQAAAKSDIFPRYAGPATRNPMRPWSHLAVQRITTEAALLANCSGMGRVGVDFWPVLGQQELAKNGEKHFATLVARFPNTDWYQLNMDSATPNLLAPGPAGAVSTERFEQLREGVQDCEARIFIEKALLAGTLPPELAKKCREVLEERQWLIRTACKGSWDWYEGAGSAGLTEKLYAAAAEVAGKTGQ